MNAGVCVIVNPAAGRGRGGRALDRVREAFRAAGVTDLRTTAGPGDERRVAEQAIDEGRSTLVAVGGDGTWSNVANAILSRRADCRLALLAAGTGNDFAKSTLAPVHDASATARLAVSGPDVHVDVGRIEDRFFLNVAGFGFDIAVLEDIERIRWLKGEALYLFSAFRQLFGYRGIPIGIATASGRREPARHLMLIVANAKHFGGSFRIAPQALVTDGHLDAISVLDAPPLRRMSLFHAATRGTHVREPEVVCERSEVFTLSFDEPPAYETDGEYVRASSSQLEVTCVPRALRLVSPESAA